jgi:hypothetical protein
VLACAGIVALPLAADAQRSNRSLTISAAAPTITFGGSTRISGRLRGPSHSRRRVALQRNPFPFRGFRTVRATTTDRNGNYRFSIAPGLHTRFRTISPQAATVYEDVIRSAEVLVRVRLRVGIRLSDSTPFRGQRVRFSGTVLPKHNGRRVFVQRRRRDGRWRTVARTVTGPSASGSASRYVRRVRIRRTGLYRVKVRGHADHGTGISRVRLIRVH